MKITVNRAEFLRTTLSIPVESDVSLMVSNGILSITSFTEGITVKIVGYMLKPGQIFLTAEQWHELVHDMYYCKDLVVDINRGDT